MSFVGVEFKGSWIPAENGNVPGNAIEAGPGIFICRVKHAGEVIPGKAARGHSSAYIPCSGKEIPVTQYEVLCDTALKKTIWYSWVPASSGCVPSNAVVGGVANDGHYLYVARSKINGETVVGKLHATHKGAHFPYGGTEHYHESYEVLALK